jgi:hypothetical protein
MVQCKGSGRLQVTATRVPPWVNNLKDKLIARKWEMNHGEAHPSVDDRTTRPSAR